jgi:hypothetical protein
MLRVGVAGVFLFVGLACKISAQTPYFDSSRASQFRQQRKYASSRGDTVGQPANEMHGKPLIERIVPGVTFQVSNVNNRATTFLNPWIGYKLTDHFTAGAGWNGSLGFRHFHFFGRRRVSGPRLFLDYKMRRGFSVRAEVEWMKTYTPPNQPAGTTTTHPLECGAFAGLKKEFRVFKNIRGNVQVVYNVYRLFVRQPVNIYGDPLALRIGFEFPMKKKRKSISP